MLSYSDPLRALFVPAPSLNIIDKENDISQDEEIHQEESKCNSLEEGDEQISEAEIQEKDSSLVETNIGNDIIEPTSGSPEQSLSHNEELIKLEEIYNESVVADKDRIDNNDLHISSPEQTSIKSTESNESITSHQTDNNVESSTTEKEKQEPKPIINPPIKRNKEYLQEELRWLKEEEVRIETALLRRIEVRLYI